MAAKDEYPPLLQAGLHRMSSNQLKAMVLDAFPLSNSREGLWKSFQSLLDALTAAKVKCDIWVDGSFLTEKIDPNDVDFVVDVSIDVLSHGTAVQVDLLRQLSDQDFKKTDKLHSFVMFTSPAGHSTYSDALRVHDQWRKDFGFSYVAKTPKGIALVEVVP